MCLMVRQDVGNSCLMPKKFNTSRIYELPILRHNTAAVKLIFANATDSELSDEFLTKATTHNPLLAKLSGFSVNGVSN